MRSGGALAVVFFVVSGMLWIAFDAAALFKNESTKGRHVAAFVIFVLAVLALLLAAFFVLVEARKPVVASQQVAAIGPAATTVAGVPAIELVTKVVDAFSGRKASAALFGIAFALAVIAAAGTGLIEVSIGAGNATPASPTSGTAP